MRQPSATINLDTHTLIGQRSDMQYRITATIIKAVGTQSWLVDAETEGHAIEAYNSGKASFEAEEIEVCDIEFDSIHAVDEPRD